jgi:hypothetical protein
VIFAFAKRDALSVDAVLGISSPSPWVTKHIKKSALSAIPDLRIVIAVRMSD